jgi:geranylgeranyl pyrophosphate synthase
MANSRDGDRKYLESVLEASSREGTSLFSRCWKSLHKAKRNGFDKKQLQRIRKMLLDCGSVTYSMNVAGKFAQKAKEDLGKIPDSEARQSLISLADHVMIRER